MVVYSVPPISSTFILSSTHLKASLCLHATDSTLIKVANDLHLEKVKSKLSFFILLNFSTIFGSGD